MFTKNQIKFFYVIIALITLMLFRDYWIQDQQVANIRYDEFQQLLKEDKIKEIFIGDNYIRGEVLEPLSKSKMKFITAKVDEDLAQQLNQYKVQYSKVMENSFFKEFLPSLLPLFFFLGFWVFIIRKMMSKEGMGGGFLSVGKSKAKIYAETEIKTTFQDVAGIDEAKEELKEIVNYLKDPENYGRLGARMPKGVLLVGPPGTGKTLLVKAIAGEAQVPFFSISGSEFVEMFVGVGAARVRDLFEQASLKAPCIIFIDELDALGRARSAYPMAGGHDEKEQTLNQLLAELDGFDTKTGIILLAATNRPEILDPALLRAGRFDRQILVDRPDKAGRIDILKVHVKKVKLNDQVNLEDVAAITPGFTGADIENLVNEAAVIATRRGGESISQQDFTQALERIIAGLERKNKLLNPKEREVVAYHEMGHALVAKEIPGSDIVHKISIIPRGIGSLGYTLQQPTEDRYLMTKEELMNKMTILMGGRCAEVIKFNQMTTGATDDIVKATDIARSIVTRYGMIESLGPIAYEVDSGGFLGLANYTLEKKRYSDETASQIDLAIKNLVQEASDKATDIIKRNRSFLEKGAQVLLSKETLSKDEFEELVRTHFWDSG